MSVSLPPHLSGSRWPVSVYSGARKKDRMQTVREGKNCSSNGLERAGPIGKRRRFCASGKGRAFRGGPAHLLLPSCPGRNPLDHRSEAGRSQGLLHDLGFMLVYHRAISMRRSGFWTRRRKRRNLNPNRHQTRHQGRIRGKEKSRKCLISLVRPAGVEPATFRFVVCCSIRAELRAQKGVRNLT